MVLMDSIEISQATHAKLKSFMARHRYGTENAAISALLDSLVQEKGPIEETRGAEGAVASSQGGEGGGGECSFCGDEISGTAVPCTKACGAMYCNETCRYTHGRTHKKECK